MRHVGFADPKPCLKGVRGARITVGHRCVFRARHVKALSPEVAFRQQQLHARLGIIALLLAFRLVRIRELHQPTAQDILHLEEILLPATGHQVFTDELDVIGRQVVTVLLE